MMSGEIDVLYKEQLDATKCDNPECNNPDCSVIVFHSECHPETPSWPTYDSSDGLIYFVCCECQERYLAVAPASEFDIPLELPKDVDDES